jgi:hypothetical protein
VQPNQYSNRIFCLFSLRCALLLVYGCGMIGSVVMAQKTDSTQTVLTPRQRFVRDSIVAQRAAFSLDTIGHRTDSVRYTQFRETMYKRRLTRQLYDAVFRDIYNRSQQSGEISQIEVNPFLPFAGRVIANVYIRRLNVFGQSVYDTLRKEGNWVERVGNRLHTNTQESVIRRQFLLFSAGDTINPIQMRDNERLLRTTTIFHDARILVAARPGSKRFADVYVITQDIWSLEPDGGGGALNNFQIGLNQRNFRGLAHQVYTRFNYNGTDPIQRAEYQGRYAIPFINFYGRKTFATAEGNVLWFRDIKQASIRLSKPFVTPDTKVAYAVEMNITELRNRIFARNDSAVFFPLRYRYTDGWIGRSFRVKVGNAQDERRARIVVALRGTRYTFVKRPAVTADSNQLYQNSRTVLVSVGYSQRQYVRDVLIYGFGRTEDVPVGGLFSVVAGSDYAELGQRNYTGINFSRGQYLRSAGYLYGLVSIGGYMRTNQNELEQGTFSATANYFSPLMKNAWGQMRHFLNFRYTTGVNRFNNEFISLAGTEGLGVSTDALRGTNRLQFNYETILFSELNVIGFRVAFIGFANLGLISFSKQPLLQTPLYQGYGLGFRFRNENLTFNSFQIRLAYYPNVPGISQRFRYDFEGIPTLRFRDFGIEAPTIVGYQ